MERVDRVVRTLEDVFTGVLVTAMLGVVTLQIVFRYALGRPLSWSSELAVFLLVALVFVGMACGQRERAHVAMRLFPALDDSPLGRWASLGAMLALFGLIGWGGLGLIAHNGAQHSPALNLPFWAVLAVLPFSAALGIYHTLRGR